VMNDETLGNRSGIRRRAGYFSHLCDAGSRGLW